MTFTIDKFRGMTSHIKVNFEYFQQVMITPEAYDGDYSIVPKAEAQQLPTKKKYMEDNITITAIPYFDVANPSGGQTIYIGSEVEING